MEDQVTSSKASAEQPSTTIIADTLEENRTAAAITPSADVAATEHRQAYGTAKTENLRDSGLWRILLPGFILVACLAILAVPLIILVDLLYGALTSTGSADVVTIHHQLAWLWVVMIILSLGLVTIIIRYFINTFFSQSNNYRKA
jgi:hypothetical protein